MKKYLTPLFFILLVSCNKKDKLENIIKSNNAYYTKAWYFSDNQIPDSSFIYFNKAKEEFSKNSDSINIAKCLINMAIISSDQGDYFGSQELSLSAIKYLNTKHENQKEVLSSNYNNLGKVAHLLKKYDDANQFYTKSIDLSNSENSRYIYLNNIAINLSNQKKFNEALNYFERLMENKNIRKNNITFSRILSNISKTRWLQDSNYNAAPPLLKALNIRIKENDLLGQNASYSHLADYYMQINSDSALFYANKMYKVAKKIKSPDDQLQALQKLIKLSPQKEARQYFEIYQNLDDSLQTARSAAKNQFALIRYETEKNKADFLKAQAENIKKQSSILIRNIGIGILIVFSIVSYLWYRRRQKILKQEKEIEVKNTEIKYVKKVHDHVANRIYQVMDEIDNRPQMDKNEVAEKLDVIYHISRDLSYESIDTKYKQGFAKALSKMFSSYQSAKVNIAVKGNEEKIWEGVQETVKEEVFTILQELMTNMKKHSEADVVQFAFQRAHQRITVLYSDNGKGIRHFLPGNGLKNTETRIKSISGIITFDTRANEGLNVKFSFPI